MTSLEQLLAAGEVEAALLLKGGPYTERELELIRDAWSQGLRQGKELTADRGISSDELLENMGIDLRAIDEPVFIMTKGGPATIEFSWFSHVSQWGDVWFVHDRCRADEIVARMWLRDGESQTFLMPLELDRHWVARACRYPQVHRDFGWNR